jgi:hypothetical protein
MPEASASNAPAARSSWGDITYEQWLTRLVAAKWSDAPELGRCRTCRNEVYAASLDGVGDCVQCAHHARWEWGRQQLTLEMAA